MVAYGADNVMKQNNIGDDVLLPRECPWRPGRVSMEQFDGKDC